MNPKLKSIFVISAKHAVNALIVNGVFNTLWGQWHQLATKAGMLQALSLAASTIIAREIVVWGPKILAWSQSTNGNGSANAAAAGGR